MTQEALKKMYQLLLTEPHAPTVCAQLERIAREALAEHTMQEVQRLGQEIEQEPKIKTTDPFESSRVADYNRGWNDCLFASGIVKQPEQEPKIGCVNHDCDQCKAQPDQEPVAFASHGVINWIADKQFQHEADLYTTPPQQTWVGLNDDEIDYLIHLAYTGDEEFVQTIEAKLKEKNLPCIKPKWIGLTEKEHTDIAVECGCMSADWVFYGAAVERKLKERNT